MTCRWILPCRRTPTVFYLGGFFCSYHARLIQGFKASRRSSREQGGTAVPSAPRAEQRAGGVPPLDDPGPPLTEDELATVLEMEADYQGVDL